MYIALDIGGTNTRVAFFENDKLIKVVKSPSDKNNFEAAMDKIAETIGDTTNIKGIGVSAPGPANFETGVFGELPNLPGWSGKNLKEALTKRTNITNIETENDANLMALAHHFYFKNEGKITQFFTVSTGLGAGLVINDKIYTGAHGLAQEVAFVPVSWIKEEGKGLTEGALEYFSSGSGLALRGGKETKEVLELKSDSDKRVVQDGIETLANMIATVVALIDPDTIVFDGSVTRYNQWYVEKAWELAKTRAYKGHFDNVEMKIAELGDDAGLYGAYQLIKHKEK